MYSVFTNFANKSWQLGIHEKCFGARESGESPELYLQL